MGRGCQRYQTLSAVRRRRAPRGTVIDGAYTAYFQQGQQLEDAKDWQNAIDSFQNALKAKDTAEARDALKGAEKELSAAQDATAATAALEKSKMYELQHDMIPAYEVLTSLPEGQRAIVKDDIDPPRARTMLTAASQRAKDIAKAYPTVQGIGDEKAVESAYAFLQRASELTDDEARKQAFQTRMQNLGDELSIWFLDRAKHSLQKPLGSGTELGWAYLKEAEVLQGRQPRSRARPDEDGRPGPRMHSNLSIRVQFRDQTSQRQSEGFANQMESAIAAGLDTSGMPVKVIRSADTLREDVEPDFLIAGDVLEHHIAAPPTVESVDSNVSSPGSTRFPAKSGTRPTESTIRPPTNCTPRRLRCRAHRPRARRRKSRKRPTRWPTPRRRWMTPASTLDSIAKSKTEDIIRPYTYKKTTYDVLNRVVLQFRIDDIFSGQKGEPVQVSEAGSQAVRDADRRQGGRRQRHQV